MKFGVYVFFCCSVSQVVAHGNEKSDVMKLVSETTNYSARIARNKNATENEKKKDRERRRIGIGEEVTITLTCNKPVLLEPKDQIQWKVTKGKELLDGELVRNKNNPELVIFRVSPRVSKEEVLNAKELVIEVETQQGTALPEPIKFEVVFPQQLSAEHKSDGGMVKGTPIPTYPKDKSPIPCVSAQLIVSVHPLDVCYEDVRVIEKDKGYEEPVGSLGMQHEADSKWNITKENRFHIPDNISFDADRATLNQIERVDDNGNPVYMHTYPNDFVWKCLFRVVGIGDNDGISDISMVHQRFHIDRRADGQFYMKIKKFLVDPEKKDECSVERTTGGDHIFNP